jgi:hypothetical protein
MSVFCHALLILGCFRPDFLGDNAVYIALVLVPYYNNKGNITTVKCSLAALNTKQQKNVIIFYGKITMGFMPCLLQFL